AAHRGGCAMAEADHVTCRGALARAVPGSPLRALPSWPLFVAVCQRFTDLSCNEALVAGKARGPAASRSGLAVNVVLIPRIRRRDAHAAAGGRAGEARVPDHRAVRRAG